MGVSVGVNVGVGVPAGVAVAVKVGAGFPTANFAAVLDVGLGVEVDVGVGVYVALGVAVAVAVGVGEKVGVGVAELVGVGVEVPNKATVSDRSCLIMATRPTSKVSPTATVKRRRLSAILPYDTSLIRLTFGNRQWREVIQRITDRWRNGPGSYLLYPNDTLFQPASGISYINLNLSIDGPLQVEERAMIPAIGVHHP